MRSVDRGVYEPGPTAGNQALQLVDHLAHQECRLGLVGGEGWGCPGGAASRWNGHIGPRPQEAVTVRDIVTPVLQPPVPGLPVLWEVQRHPESGKGSLVVLEARIVVGNGARVHRGIRMAEQHRVVPGCTGLQGHVGEAGVQRRAVLDRPVDVLVGTGQQAGPAGATGGSLGVVRGEPDALGGEAVQVRSLHHRMSGRAETVAAPLVEGDEQDVRTTHAYTSRARAPSGHPASPRN